jgi:hypothetical protein
MRKFVTVSGMECAVVPVSKAGMMHYERTNTPIAEVEAPDGYEFLGGETVLCVHSKNDLDRIEAEEALVPIEED